VACEWPLHPFQRLYRETCKYEKVSPSGRTRSFKTYLQAVAYMVPTDDANLTRPILRHPGLQPNNMFISDDLNITGLIDWQHSASLPLFLQCSVPNSFQNNGDSVSEALIPPKLPPNFDELSEQEDSEQVSLLRKRQLHYFYVAATDLHNLQHYKALAHDSSVTRRKTWDHATSPWEGDNITLKADLVTLQQKWSEVTTSHKSEGGATTPPYPVDCTSDEIQEVLRLHNSQVEMDELLQSCRNIAGIGSDGRVSFEQYDRSIEIEEKLKQGAIEAAESEEERQALCDHWVFGDFDESEHL
jgi:hypothetical protein